MWFKNLMQFWAHWRNRQDGIRARRQAKPTGRWAKTLLWVEALEGRTVPATFIVDTLIDENDFSIATTSLREAVYYTNITAGADTIVFASNLTGGTINLLGGSIEIYDSTTIDATGASGYGFDITVDGQYDSRIFEIDDREVGAVDVEISGLTLVNGFAYYYDGASPHGGAILIADANVTLDGVTITNSEALGSGGAIAKFGDGELVLVDVTLDNNSAGSQGGGLFIYYQANGDLIIDSSTFAFNEATDGGGGGASINAADGTVLIVNSTFSYNTAAGRGGGIEIGTATGHDIVEIYNSTIAYNDAANAGGGIYSAVDLLVMSTILSGNVAAFGDDIAGEGTFNTYYSLVYSTIGANIGGTNNIYGQLADLGPLQDNGGPTETMLPTEGSPAIDQGSNFLELDFDQRGPGFPRTIGAGTDIGAVETPPPPMALNVVKSFVSITNKDGSNGGTVVNEAGDIINFSITVANIGNTTLTGLVVTDSLDPTVDPKLDPQGHNVGDTNDNDVFDSGETWCFVASYTVTQQDIDSNGGGDGDIDNLATADTNETQPDTDPESVPLIPNFMLNIVKTVSSITNKDGSNGGTVVNEAGDIINFSITVANIGNTILTGLVVTDSLDPTVDPKLDPQGHNVGDTNDNDVFDPSETWCFEASYTVTQENIDSNGGGDGGIDNLATADTNETPPDTDTETAPLLRNRELNIVKSFDSITNKDGSNGGTVVNEAGDIINFSITVANIGNTTLTGLVVTDSLDPTVDPKLDPQGHNVGDTNDNDVFDPGETWCFEASYTVTQENIDSNGGGDGDIDNLATADTNETPPDTDPESVPIVPPDLPGNIVVGVTEGGNGVIKVFDANGKLMNTIVAFPEHECGVSVAQGDVNGDGFIDIIAGTLRGGNSHIKVFSGYDDSLLEDFFAFEGEFPCGVYVAAGDVDGDGVDDIIAGAGAGGGPRVVVYKGGTDGTVLLKSFFAFQPNMACGVKVAAGNFDGDTFADVVVGAGSGGGPHVIVFEDGNSFDVFASFFAFESSFAGGVTVAAGDVTGDGLADVIVGRASQGSEVRVFDNANASVLVTAFDAYPGFSGGVRVGAVDLDGDGEFEIVTGPGQGGGPHVKAFDLPLDLIASFYAATPGFTGGLWVA